MKKMQPDSALAQAVCAGDYGLYVYSLLLPETQRDRLWVWLGLIFELERIPSLVNEPMLGHIRLAWWRERIAEIFEDKRCEEHAVLVALSDLKYDAEERQAPEFLEALYEDITLKIECTSQGAYVDEEAWRQSRRAIWGGVFAHVFSVNEHSKNHALLLGMHYGMQRDVLQLPLTLRHKASAFPAVLRGGDFVVSAEALQNGECDMIQWRHLITGWAEQVDEEHEASKARMKSGAAVCKKTRIAFRLLEKLFVLQRDHLKRKCYDFSRSDYRFPVAWLLLRLLIVRILNVS